MTPLISRIREDAPFLQSVVLLAKKVNKERGVEDTQANVIQSMMAMVGTLASEDIESLAFAVSTATKTEAGLQPSPLLDDDEVTTPPKPISSLDRMEADAGEHLRRINAINLRIRKATEEYKLLVEKVKAAKNQVVEEYRDVLGQFRTIMDESDVDANEKEGGNATSFHTILEDVIREVLIESDAIPIDESSNTATEGDEKVSEFESLFEDQQLSAAFIDVFQGDGVVPDLDEDGNRVIVDRLPDPIVRTTIDLATGTVETSVDTPQVPPASITVTHEHA